MKKKQPQNRRKNRFTLALQVALPIEIENRTRHQNLTSIPNLLKIALLKLLLHSRKSYSFNPTFLKSPPYQLNPTIQYSIISLSTS